MLYFIMPITIVQSQVQAKLSDLHLMEVTELGLSYTVSISS